jgi:hypothetical protein
MIYIMRERYNRVYLSQLVPFRFLLIMNLHILLQKNLEQRITQLVEMRTRDKDKDKIISL